MPNNEGDVGVHGNNVLISFLSIERLADTIPLDPTRLDENAVHLWGIELDGSQRCLERCTGWLDEVERHRAARLVREDLRQRYVLAHGGLRAVLSRYLGVDPNVIALNRSATGKPFLTKELRDRSAITFNLSHAHDRALIAVSKAQEVGVDLEFVRADIEVENLSKRFFTRSEHTAVMQVPEERRATRFFRYWVAKEALLKTQGIGLRGLPDCEIFLEGDAGDTEVRARLGAQFSITLRVRVLHCENGWEAAVAAQTLDSVRQCGPEEQ
ncbi:MAG: 4'-phosphopantetheinyl transferase superfamily protein [Nitrospira sp.]|nr:4'-phosphopantetheinyl transferase superfamily protein [Nitrospira sp.]